MSWDMGWGVPPNPASLSSDKVYVILEDRAGALWLGTRDGGLNRLDPATGVFSHYRHDPTDAASLSNDNVFALWEDDDGALWVGTDGGLDRFDPAAGTFTRYRHNPDDPTGLSNDAIRALLADSDGTLWVGTWGGGLARLNPDTGEVTHYDHENGLPGDAVFDIQEDGQGRLWLSTSNGLSRFDPRTETFRNYDERDGLPGNVFESGVSFRSPSGEMFFGATDGLLAFDPDQIHDKLTAPPPPQYAPTPAPAPAPAAGGSDLTAQLGQLSQLHHAGVLSDEEFAQAKQKLLAG